MAGIFSFISQSAEVSSEVEPTLGDAVHELLSKPEEAAANIGDFFAGVWDRILNALPSIIFAIIILVVGLLFSKLCVKLMSKGLSKTKLEVTVIKFSTQMAKIILYVLVITVVLSMLGIPATSIITVIGTAGVAIGLALQNSLSNVAGGFLLMISKPFKIGDYIISNGVEGTVTQISILHTRLDTLTNQAVFIPNGLAVNAVVINNTGNDDRRIEMRFSISYESDYEKAKKIIEKLVKAHPKVDASRDIFVRMSAHGESAVVILVRAWCKTADFWDVHFDLLEQVRAEFIEKGIEIPFNQLDVNIKSPADKGT